MRSADVLILGTTFLRRNEKTLTAFLTLVLTLVVVIAADRAFARWAARRSLSPEVDTRLRFLRRLLTLAIALLGVLFAISQFGGLNQLAAGILASSAILAAVLGFAARQVLANLIAGVMLTITQPLRIGDQIAIDEHAGSVEDVRLNYTVIRGADGERFFIPNERLAASVLRNDTIIDPTARPQISLWLPFGADAERALSLLAAEDAAWSARAADVTPDGIRIAVAGAATLEDRAAMESAMRIRAVVALTRAGLLTAPTGA